MQEEKCCFFKKNPNVCIKKGEDCGMSIFINDVRLVTKDINEHKTHSLYILPPTPSDSLKIIKKSMRKVYATLECIPHYNTYGMDNASHQAWLRENLFLPFFINFKKLKTTLIESDKKYTFGKLFYILIPCLKMDP